MEPDTLIFKSVEEVIREMMLRRNLVPPLTPPEIRRLTSVHRYPTRMPFYEHPKDFAALVSAEKLFTQDIFKAASEAWGEGENLSLSPVCLMLSLGVAYVNSEAENEAELSKALHWTRGREAFERGAEDVMAALVIPRCQRAYQMSLTNLAFRRWVPGEEHDYYKGVANLFHANPTPAPLTCPPAARRQINATAQKETKGRLRNLVPRGWLRAGAGLVGVSGVHLRGFFNPGPWRRATAFREFWTGVGTSVRVPMLHVKGNFITYHDPHLHAGFLLIPFLEGMFLVLVVPEAVDGLAALEAHLTPQLLHATLSSTQPSRTLLALPKMKLDQTKDYTGAIKQLGVRHPVPPAHCPPSEGGEARWRGCLDHLIHRVVMPFDEDCSLDETQDAAEVMKGPEQRFFVDRPFHWQVVHLHTLLVLLKGRVTNPATVNERQPGGAS